MWVWLHSKTWYWLRGLTPLCGKLPDPIPWGSLWPHVAVWTKSVYKCREKVLWRGRHQSVLLRESHTSQRVGAKGSSWACSFEIWLGISPCAPQICILQTHTDPVYKWLRSQNDNRMHCPVSWVQFPPSYLCDIGQIMIFLGVIALSVQLEC